MLELCYKKFNIWGEYYQVFQDRWYNYYFRSSEGKWITPAHQRYFRAKYPITLNILFKLKYTSVLGDMVPTYNLLNEIKPDGVSSGIYHHPVVIKC